MDENKGQVVKCYLVDTVRWNDKKGTKSRAFYLAESMKQLTEEVIKLDLHDESVEIEVIQEVGTIVGKPKNVVYNEIHTSCEGCARKLMCDSTNAEIRMFASDCVACSRKHYIVDKMLKEA